MQSKYKIAISKLAIVLIAISLAMSGIVLFNIGINVRMIHLLIPALFFLLLLVKFKWIKRSKFIFNEKLFFWFFIYLLISFYSTLFISAQESADFKLWIAIFINSLFGLVFYGIFIEDGVDLHFLEKLSYYSIVVICLIIPLQLLFSAIGIYEPHMYGENGFFLLGRPSAFFGDPGWLAYWLIFFSLIIFKKRSIGNINSFEFFFLIIVMVIALIINQSRISILFIITNYYLLVLYKKYSSRFLLIFSLTLGILLMSIFIYVGIIQIPENLYYDIVKLKANPRFYDSITIYEEYLKSDNLWFGNGLGSLDRLVETYPWRNFTNSHNIFFLQILNDTGIFGILVMIIIIVKLYKKIKSRIGRIMFIEFIILLNFHNIFPYFQLFWFLLALIFVLDIKYEQRKSFN